MASSGHHCKTTVNSSIYNSPAESPSNRHFSPITSPIFELDSVFNSSQMISSSNSTTKPTKPLLTASKSYLAKLNWWNAPAAPIQPLELNRTIKTALAANNNAAREITEFWREEKINDEKTSVVVNMISNDFASAAAEAKPNDPLIETTAAAAGCGDGDFESPKSKAHFTRSYSHTSASRSLGSRTRQRKLSDDDNTSQNSQLLIKDRESCIGLLNPEEEDEMKVTGYNRSKFRTAICWLCIILTGGLLRLLMHWWRHWYLIATHKPCPLDEAEKVLIQEDFQEKHNIYYVKKIYNLTSSSTGGGFDRNNDLFEVDGNDGSGDVGGGGDGEKAADDDFVKKTITASPNQTNKNDNMYLTLHFSSAQFKKREFVKVFSCKQLRYAWDIQTKSFRKINGLDVNISSAYFHQQKGLSPQERESRRLVFGNNEISVPYKSVTTLLFLEVLNPFYVFQIFSVILWFAYDYYYYACVIVLMSVFGITMSIIQTKKNQDAIRETVLNSGTVKILNDKGNVKEIPTQLLVPGDLIEIPRNGCTMHCDAVLLSGNCIVDESMLTGESVPITKTPLPAKRDVIFDKKEHARHSLFCGTKVIQTRYIGTEKVLALVINTGNITAKGGLIRSILYPPPVDYRFEQDAYKFIAVLGLIAGIGFIYTLVTKILRNVGAVKIAVESLDLITIVVPPALPAAMTVGRLYAQKRLEKNNIYCISPRSINVAGSIDCCCFDKTGTLTEDGLDMWGVVPKSATNQFQIPIKEIDRLPNDNFLFGMATCHAITVMNGKMMGDPLDLKMFESTGWILEDPQDIPDNQKYDVIHPTIVRQPPKKPLQTADVSDDSEDPKISQRQSSMDDLLADVGLLDGEHSNDHGIVREFPFTSNLQRMSVITRRLSEKNFTVYCKGSPEMLQQLCRAESIPHDYSQQLASFAKQGYRIIALAYKALGRKLNFTKVLRLSRERVECDLEFLGFVIMENRLKADTTKVVHILNEANIRTIMVTGDNILTALSVARDCGIICPTQAVVMVNVRYVDGGGGGGARTAAASECCNYELYYTLELGNEGMRSLANDVVNGVKSASATATVASLQQDNNSSSCRQLVNGDLASLNSVTDFTMANSGSIASVATCDTWTHNHDAELGGVGGGGGVVCDFKKTTTSSASYKDLIADTWRKNYRFAMVGNTWQIVREHFPDQLRYFITRGAIFARMSPEQKQALIVELQNIDYSVAMCGDGANDCGALKVAQTGISLSETESSIASPFTSRNPTIASVPTVIKEGRTALVTSFGIFKYMASYSMVQFISVMILYSIDSNLTDKQYLYVDLGMISVFAFFFGKTEPYEGPLVKEVPLSSLISLAPLASLILHLLVVVCFQVTGWFQLQQQTWFVPFQPSYSNDENHLGCFENYTMFAISSFQYIILAFVFSKGAPYRKPIWANVPFCLALLINLCIIVYLVLYPSNWIATFFQLVVPPEMSFRYWMLVYGVTNFIAHVFVEMFIVEFLLFKKVQTQRDQNMHTSKLRHMQIEYELQNIRSWPDITEVFIEANCNSKPHQYVEDTSLKPTYVEISAEQNVDFAAPTNNALSGFFGDNTALDSAAADGLIASSNKNQFPPLT